MEYAFREVIQPLIKDASPEQIDDLISMLIDERKKRVQQQQDQSYSQPRLPSSATPIEASLNTTGWLRENELVSRKSVALPKTTTTGDTSQNLIGGNGVGRPATASSRAAMHQSQVDRLASYNPRQKLRERVAYINSMLKSPYGGSSSKSSHQALIKGYDMGKTAPDPIGAPSSAFRKRDRMIYSKVCASIVEFH